MKRVFLLILISLAFVLSNARQNADYYSLFISDRPSYSNQLIVYWENDMFLQTDYYYTNGAAFEYISNDLKIRQLEKFLNTPFTLDNRTYSFSFRQNMYTPEKTNTKELQRNDRPYAGYLVGDYKMISENRDRRFTSSLTLGVLGEYSLAGRTQMMVHSMDHLNLPVGWNYQVNNALIININYKHEQKLIDNEVFDFQYSLTGRLGSLYTDASGNATLRIGKRDSNFDFRSPVHKNIFETYFFISGGGRISYYDATLQGTILTDTPSQHYLTNAERHLFISEFTGGMVISYKFLRIKGSVTRISPEFKGGKSHGWGVVTLGLAF